MKSEVAQRASFSQIRYAQCWEDADILLEALNIQPGDVCLSIASAGDNSLAMLTQDPKQVVALDLNPAQLACLELRVAAYRELEHRELLELMGSRTSQRRPQLYQKCRAVLAETAREFWDARPDAIQQGIGSAGKFEHYFALFRNRVLPLVHSKKRITQLLKGGTRRDRLEFYNHRWDNWRWRLLFNIFFSRFVMGRTGRDPEFFRYVQGSVAKHILNHTRYALTELNPADNPYLQWILTGRHTTALPYALREEHFEHIRNNLDRLQWYQMPIEQFLDQHRSLRIQRFNLSDIFEYMSEDNYHRLLRRIIDAGTPGALLAYWNMLAPRQRPESMAERLVSLPSLAKDLYAQDKAFFYSAFVVEEIPGEKTIAQGPVPC